MSEGLQPGWFKRQSDQVEEEIKYWPAWMRDAAGLQSTPQGDTMSNPTPRLTPEERERIRRCAGGYAYCGSMHHNSVPRAVARLLSDLEAVEAERYAARAEADALRRSLQPLATIAAAETSAGAELDDNTLVQCFLGNCREAYRVLHGKTVYERKERGE